MQPATRSAARPGPSSWPTRETGSGRSPPPAGAAGVPANSLPGPPQRPWSAGRRSRFALDGHHAAAVPILRGEEGLGVLCLVGSERPIPEDDLQLLFGLCASAGTSLALVRHLVWLEGERRRLESSTEDEELRGDSPAIGRVRALLARAAASEASVLLAGESGTGKELVARALHARSARRDGPFVAVNARRARRHARRERALRPREGGLHRRRRAPARPPRDRAPRDALPRRDGRDGALDPGQAPPRPRDPLVRARRRDRERQGRRPRDRGDEPRPPDGGPREALPRGSLLPPRRRHDHPPAAPGAAEDIPDLASFFLARHAQRLGRRLDGFSPAALGRLVAYDWPGNVRELGNAVERAAVLSAGPLVRPEDLPEALVEGPASRADEALPPYHEAVNRAKQQVVSAALAQSRGNVTEAARLLGLHPNYLHRLLNQLGLREGGGA